MNIRERRKDKIIKFKRAHFGCTKTRLKNKMPFAPGTTDTLLKELIEEDKSIIYIIDKVNPRVHHLFVNNPVKLAMMNLTLSIVEARMRRGGDGGVYTIAPIVGGGVAIGSKDGVYFMQGNSTDGVKNLIESASRLKSLL